MLQNKLIQFDHHIIVNFNIMIRYYINTENKIRTELSKFSCVQ